MSTAPARRGKATIADLFAILEEERRRYELLDGELVERGAASGEHGTSQAAIGERLRSQFDRRPGGARPGGWWFASEVDLRFGEDVCRPDVVAWRRERVPERPRGALVALRPDWTCEILSTNRRSDLIRKKRIYHRHQVSHYWILDPDECTLAVYRWHTDGYLEVLAAERGQRVRAEPFDAIELAVGELFGDDPEE